MITGYWSSPAQCTEDQAGELTCSLIKGLHFWDGTNPNKDTHRICLQMPPRYLQRVGFSSIRVTSILIMANRTVSDAVLLLVFSLQGVKCQQSGFRVFRRKLSYGNSNNCPRERDSATRPCCILMYPGAEILEISHWRKPGCDCAGRH